MSLEDFTTYSAVDDEGEHQTVTANQIRWLMVAPRYYTTYVQKDFGAGYFNSDFTFTYKYTPKGDNGTTTTHHFMLSNEAGDWQSILIV